MVKMFYAISLTFYDMTYLYFASSFCYYAQLFCGMIKSLCTVMSLLCGHCDYAPWPVHIILSFNFVLFPGKPCLSRLPVDERNWGQHSPSIMLDMLGSIQNI